jgi:hypothetical protein
MTALETLRGRLEVAREEALRVYRLDKDTPSGAFDSGRYDGLKQAVEILDGVAETFVMPQGALETRSQKARGVSE